MNSWFRQKTALSAVVLALVLMTGEALAKDDAYLKHIRWQAEQLVQESGRLRRAVRYVFGCNTECQIEEEFEKIRDAPIGSIGIRG